MFVLRDLLFLIKRAEVESLLAEPRDSISLGGAATGESLEFYETGARSAQNANQSTLKSGCSMKLGSAVPERAEQNLNLNLNLSAAEGPCLPSARREEFAPPLRVSSGCCSPPLVSKDTHAVVGISKTIKVALDRSALLRSGVGPSALQCGCTLLLNSRGGLNARGRIPPQG